MKPLCRILVICILVNTTIGLFEEFAGKFYIRPKGMAACTYNSTSYVAAKFQLLRLNKTTLGAKINITFPPNSDELLCRVVFKSRATNGHNWNPVLDTTGNCCEMQKKFAYDYTVTHRINSSFTCPWKERHMSRVYPLKEPICNPFQLVPVFPYGDYKIEFSYYIKTESGPIRDTCHVIYAEIRPAYEIGKAC